VLEAKDAEIVRLRTALGRVKPAARRSRARSARAS